MSGVRNKYSTRLNDFNGVESFFPLQNDNNVIDLLLHPHDEFGNKKKIQHNKIHNKIDQMLHISFIL